MKKIAIFFLFVIIIISTISYIYLNNLFVFKNAQRDNKQFMMYINKDISGFELTTLINKVVDYNKDNEENAINIDIKFLDNDTTYNMKQIYNGGMDKFFAYYKDIKFKCTQVQYYDNNKIKYIIFEQVTE